MTRDEVIQSIAAYALNALEPDEMAEVHDYLEQHPDLRQRAQELADAATQMAYAAPQITLPPSLKSRIMEVAVADATLNQSPTPSTTAAPLPVESHEEEAPTVQEGLEEQPPIFGRAGLGRGQAGGHRQGVPLRSKGTAIASSGLITPPKPIDAPSPQQARGASRNWFAQATGWKVASLAALAAAVVLAIINAQMLLEANDLRQQLSGATETAAGLEAQVATLEENNSTLEAQLATANANNTSEELAAQVASLQEEIAALQAENQLIREEYNEAQLQQASLETQLTSIAQTQTFVPIFGTEDTPDALGGLFAGPQGNVLALRNLETLPAEQTYELWVIDEAGEPVPAGLLGPDAPQRTTIDVELPGDIENYTAVAVSIEPAGGSEQPTGPIVMLGTRT